MNSPEIENVGLYPDIPVDNLPHQGARGRDAPLEVAISTILERLKERK